MTNGQIAKLEELRKCYLLPADRRDVDWFLVWDLEFVELMKYEKDDLRRLWHQYRHQIAAMKKVRERRLKKLKIYSVSLPIITAGNQPETSRSSQE